MTEAEIQDIINDRDNYQELYESTQRRMSIMNSHALNRAGKIQELVRMARLCASEWADLGQPAAAADFAKLAESAEKL